MSSRNWLAFTAVFYLVLGVGYSLLVPIWEAPDEPAHYNLAVYVARARGLPPPGHPNYETNQPPLFYLLTGLPLSIVDRIDPSAVTYYQPHAFPQNIQTRTPVFNWNEANYRFLWGPWILRLISLGLGLGSLVFNHMAFRQLLADRVELIAAATLLTGLTPQFLHISASINNDNLANLAGAAIFYLIVRLASVGWSPTAGILAVVLAVASPVLVKLTVLPISLVGLMICLYAWRLDGRSAIPRQIVPAGLALLALLVLAGLVLPSGLLQTLRSELSWRLFSLHPRAGADLTPWDSALNITMTYWGKIGWVALGFPLLLNQSLLALSLLGLIGSLPRLLPLPFRLDRAGRLLAVGLATYAVLALDLLQFGGFRALAWSALLFIPWAAVLILWLRRGHSGEPGGRRNRVAWVAVWVLGVLTALTVARNALTTLQMQARFAFPALGAISLLIAGGWNTLLPPSFRHRLPVITALALLALNIYLWLDGVLPIYFQPWF